MRKLPKILIAITVAVFFTVTVINNTLDYTNTFSFIYHTLSMDMTKQNPHFMWRAMTQPVLQHAAFIAIIMLQALIALLCWCGAANMINHYHSDSAKFAQAKSYAILGCGLGFMLYGLGFLTMAGQWFMMREVASVWNVQNSIHAFMTLMGISLICLYLAE